MNDAEIKIVRKGESGYPDSLMRLGKSAPQKLYCVGDIRLMSMRCAAVVGARNSSNYGRWAAYSAGRTFAANGIVTVSGMAAGCDASAHRGALESGGHTVAVLGCGVDVCYPRQNLKLRDEIAEKGLLISEFEPGAPPLARFFPSRNRIISGLSEEVVIAEAGVSSGSLITAGFAAEQGKNLMAFPGNICNVSSLGCNKLIQDGADPVVSLSDLIVSLGMPPEAAGENPAEFGRDERKIIDLIMKEGELTTDEIAAGTGMNISFVNALTAVLEIRGALSSSMGKFFIAK